MEKIVVSSYIYDEVQSLKRNVKEDKCERALLVGVKSGPSQYSAIEKTFFLFRHSKRQNKIR